MPQTFQKRYEFKYLGEPEYIDINTLLTSQFHFLAIINEVQKELYPDNPIQIKVETFHEGSFGISLLFETNIIDSLIKQDGWVILSEIIGAVASLIAIYKFLKGRKADKIKEEGNKINILIKGEGDINIGKDAFKIYQQNRTVSKAIKKNFELLDEDENIDGIEITEEKKDKPIISVKKEQFKNFKNPNEYLDKSQDEKILNDQPLLIKKPDYYPKGIVKWGFIYKSRNIIAEISDEGFIEEIAKGTRFGKGDGLIVDLKIFSEWDETFQIYIESNKYEILAVKKVVLKEQQGELFGNEEKTKE